MDIIEEYIKIKHPLATTVYKDEIRAKFKSVDYKIIDFINLYLDKEGQKVAMEIIKKIYTMYVIKEGKAKKPISEKQKERKENYVEEDENLKFYEEGKKEMNEGIYKMLLKRYNQKLEFSDDDYDDLMRRVCRVFYRK